MLEGWKVGRVISGRREFLGTVTLSVLSIIPSFQLSNAVQDSLPDAGPAGKLWDPARAGRSIPPTTAGDNDPAIQAIEKRLKCTCGCGLDVYTCRTTDFTCPVSPGLHRKVTAMAGDGMSAEQIIADFVRENGVVMLMAPPARGFNLTAYLLPGFAILGTGAALVFAILRWARRSRPAEPTAGMTSVAPATAAELDQLRHELDRIDA